MDFFFFEHFEEKTLFKEAEEPTTREKKKAVLYMLTYMPLSSEFSHNCLPA